MENLSQNFDPIGSNSLSRFVCVELKDQMKLTNRHMLVSSRPMESGTGSWYRLGALVFTKPTNCWKMFTTA